MWRQFALMGFALTTVSFAVSLSAIDAAHAVNASPPSCRYGGKTCKVCEEFEVLPSGKKRCVKCVLDKSKTECIIRFF